MTLAKVINGFSLDELEQQLLNVIHYGWLPSEEFPSGVEVKYDRELKQNLWSLVVYKEE